MDKDLKQACRIFMDELHNSKILQAELLNSKDKYKYLEEKVKAYMPKTEKVAVSTSEQSLDVGNETGITMGAISSSFSTTKPTATAATNSAVVEKSQKIPKDRTANSAGKPQAKSHKDKQYPLSWKNRFLKLLIWLSEVATIAFELMIPQLETHIDIAPDEEDTLLTTIAEQQKLQDKNNVKLEPSKSGAVLPELFVQTIPLTQTLQKPPEETSSPVTNEQNRSDISKAESTSKDQDVTMPWVKVDLTPQQLMEEENNLRNQEITKTLKQLLRKKYGILRSRWWSFLNKLLLFTYCHTDLIIYFIQVLIPVVNPTLYNVIFVILTFGYSALCYPYPHQIYWTIVGFYCQLLAAYEYLMRILQKVFENQLVFHGWQGAYAIPFGLNGSSLLSATFLYFLLIIFIDIHKNTLRRRGDWMVAESREALGTESQPASPSTTMPQLRQGIFGDDDDDDGTVERYQPPLMSFSKAPSEFMEDDVVFEEEDGEKADDFPLTPVQIEPLQQEDHEYDEYVDDGEDDEPEIEDEAVEEDSKLVTFFRFMYESFNDVIFRLTASRNKIGGDYYFVMLTVELISYVLFMLTFQLFTGRELDDITGAITTNELPGTLVIILFVMFIVMIIDRIIFTYQSLFWKLVFNCILVLTYSVTYLVIYNLLMEQNFLNTDGLGVLKVLFMLKCFYLLISCWQLKFGYSISARSDSLTQHFSLFAYYLYEAWRKVPFLYELKTLLDWTFTRTSLRFYYWIKLEDIHATIYRRKVELDYWKNLKPPRQIGETQTLTTKLLGGFLVFVLICLILFFPLFFFSTANVTNVQFNTISSMKVSVVASGFDALYSNQLILDNPRTFDYSMLPPKYKVTGFDQFLQLQLFQLNNNSENIWPIADPSRQSLISYLLRDSTGIDETLTTFSVVYDVTRQGPPTRLQVRSSQDLQVTAAQKQVLAESIMSGKEQFIEIPYAYNPLVFNSAVGLTPVVQANEPHHEMQTRFPNCSLSIRTIPAQNGRAEQQFWNFQCPNQNIPGVRNLQTGGPFFIIQSSRISENSAVTNFISSFGIIAFYTTFVLALGNIFRFFMSGLVERIFYEDLKNVDLLHAFLLDIYAARHYQDFELEETMFLALLGVYQNHTLLQSVCEDELKLIPDDLK